MVVKTQSKQQVLDITDVAGEQIKPGTTGVLVINVLHTTAAITTADLDPGTDLDLLEFLDRITPSVNWRHAHNPAHTPSHLLSSVIGSSVTLPVKDGTLLLGTWQRLILIELDGPRARQLDFTFISS